MHDEGNNAPPLGKWEERINAEKKVSQHLGISEIQTGIFALMDHALEIQ